MKKLFFALLVLCVAAMTIDLMEKTENCRYVESDDMEYVVNQNINGGGGTNGGESNAEMSTLSES
jgi:hypothetical protein